VIAFKTLTQLKSLIVFLNNTFLLSLSTGLFLFFLSQQQELCYVVLSTVGVFTYYSNRLKINSKRFFGLLFFVVLSFLWNQEILSFFSVLHLSAAALAAFFYVRKDKSLREIPSLKAYYIALVWTLVCLGAKPNVSLTQYLLNALVFLGFFFMLAVASDVKDRDEDPTRLKTLPQVYSWNFLRRLFFTLSAVNLIVTYFWLPTVALGMAFVGLYISIRCLVHSRFPKSFDLDLAIFCFAIGMGIQNNKTPIVATFLSLPH